jgi:hypothetical protein
MRRLLPRIPRLHVCPCDLISPPREAKRVVVADDTLLYMTQRTRQIDLRRQCSMHVHHAFQRSRKIARSTPASTPLPRTCWRPAGSSPWPAAVA